MVGYLKYYTDTNSKQMSCKLTYFCYHKGTGRNIAPFVEMEWGKTAYDLMWQIKSIFDPHGILNPGVILNTNSTVHLENFKPLPATHPLVDKCIECGFCESVCPSRNVTLTPRQRIVIQREITHLKATVSGFNISLTFFISYTPF
jgi:D-lactate dehydrogenase